MTPSSDTARYQPEPPVAEHEEERPGPGGFWSPKAITWAKRVRRRNDRLIIKWLWLDSRRAEACLAVAKQCGVPLMVGFNRRFDPNFARLEREVRDGRIGELELLTIISRDPAPPPLDFVRRSGGLFRDMMIHDLDMACWLSGEAPAEIFAMASVLVDPAIGARQGGACAEKGHSAERMTPA